MSQDYQEICQMLDEMRAQRQMSIVRLSEPIRASFQNSREPDGKRDSNASSAADVQEAPSPASLDADLQHYKDLFTKLRFSYVEQVTKEKFLRAVVGEPPLYVEESDNSGLEARLLKVKGELKRQKLDVADIVAELERQGRNLSQRRDAVDLQMQLLRDLPAQISSLQNKMGNLRAQRPENSRSPTLLLPLGATLTLLEDREAELLEVDRELEKLESASSRDRQELEGLQRDLKPLETRKANAILAAKDARRRREDGASDVDDELEGRGRWLCGEEAVLKSILQAG